MLNANDELGLIEKMVLSSTQKYEVLDRKYIIGNRCFSSQLPLIDRLVRLQLKPNPKP